MNYSLSQFAGKTAIVCFWLVVIISVLYTGKVIHKTTGKKSINVLVWGQILSKDFLSDFEQETGITVNMTYFESNEELLVKLQSAPDHGYDLVMPSDWAVEILIEKGLIKKLDRSRIHVWDTLYPSLCNQYFDRGNQYSIPFYWSLFGIAVDRRYWVDEEPPKTWGLVFDEAIMPKRIAMVEDVRELISIAGLYLFGRYDTLNSEEIEKIKQALLQQKKYVEIYTNSRSEFVLASGVVPLAV